MPLVLTQEQFDTFKQLFAAFDINGDGLVSQTEMREMLPKAGCPESEIDASIEDAFKGEEKINFQEFLNTLLPQ